MSSVAGNPRRRLGGLRETFGDSRNQGRIVLGLVIFSVVYAMAYNDVRQGALQGVFESLPFPSVNNLIVMFYYAILALGLNIVVGFAGLLDLGYVAFYVFGAYATAMLASPIFGLHVPWWIVVWVAVIVAATAGILLGAPTLRLRGDYLAIVTLGFGEIIPVLARNLDRVNINVGFAIPAIDLLGIHTSEIQVIPQFRVLGPDFNLTGGNIGVNPIDAPKLPIPGPWGNELVFSNGNPVAAFCLILALLLLVFGICVRLRDSRLGRAWMAIREDETAAASMGINTVSTKLLAFALGASFSGFTGAFFGSYSTAVFPESFNFAISISILIMIILGGMGSLRGVVLGAFTIQYLNQALLPYLGKIIDSPIQSVGAQIKGVPVLGPLLADFTLTSYNFLLYGLILVLMMLYRPEGLLPVAERKAELHGEGIASEGTFGTAEEVAEAATEFEESIHDLDTHPPAGAAGPGDSTGGVA
jgi:branched-chain amino acid transport system permease protein